MKAATKDIEDMCFGLTGMDEHRRLQVEQFKFGGDVNGRYMQYRGRISKNVQGRLNHRQVELKSIKQQANNTNPRGNVMGGGRHEALNPAIAGAILDDSGYDTEDWENDDVAQAQHVGLSESWDNLMGFMEERLNNLQAITVRKFGDNKPAIFAYDNINRFRAVLHMRVLEGKYLQALQKDERYQAIHKDTGDNVVSDRTSEYPQLNKLREWDCDVALLSYNHKSRRVYNTGTDAGKRFIKNNPQVEWAFHSSVANERGSFSGRYDGFPYQGVKEKKYHLEGLPEGFELKKPGEMRKGKLDTILRLKDVIVIKENLTVQDSSSTSTVQGQGTNQDDVPMPAITAPKPNSSATECRQILNRIDNSEVEPADDDQIYTIECLVRKVKDKKKVHNEVKWLGYPAERNTVESYQHLLKSLGRSDK
ncbi:Hypp6865 [Branchiostoma lanceolatum]|uniref:Hypp6865 protein n=1 Tax=Branchiostoma lanceolatum TaxID=7740 RepID=A0A8J9YVR9_BRALA|nr:Hypp6865 [Branchiostoma lanceolatum]